METTLARSTDPSTSHAAAERVPEFKAKQEAKIFGVLCDIAPAGMTYRAIALFAGLEPVAVARRLRAMERRGVIRTTGEVRNGCRAWAKA